MGVPTIQMTTYDESSPEQRVENLKAALGKRLGQVTEFKVYGESVAAHCAIGSSNAFFASGPQVRQIMALGWRLSPAGNGVFCEPAPRG